MSKVDQEWTQRHIAAFRYHRGHGACTVEGCTGSQPMMWVPTEAEDQQLAALEVEVADLAARAEAALADADLRKSARLTLASHWSRGSRHIHWAI